MARQRKFEKNEPVLYKGFHAIYFGGGDRRNLAVIKMERSYVMKECRELSYQANLNYWRSNREFFFFQVMRTSLKPMYQTNAQAKMLLEVDY